MCGICGIIDPAAGFPSEERRATVARMNEALYHRGPDEAGSYTDPYCDLAMRRLSIIDLGGGQQPIYNETREVMVFFNGEIYNYQELRQKLLSRGHRLSTDSDTEVLVHLYEDQGEDFLHELKGMFAFCLYDRRRRIFLLARDRFGEKPLYYHWKQGILTFASEVRSLLENKRIGRKLDQEALPYYFRTSLVPEPLTLLCGVKSLPAGHLMIVQDDELTVRPYFRLSYRPDPKLRSEEAAAALIAPLLSQAVRRQRVSDVPVGAFLSGGMDSSTVVALLQEQSEGPIPTFHVRFEDQGFDESPIARKVAEYCGTDHHEIVVPDYDFSEDLFWEIIDHVGLPFRDSSAIPTYLISRAIRRHVKVALSGDGGDELFGGYRQFHWYRQIMGLQHFPQLLRRALLSGLDLARQVPGLSGLSQLRQGRRAVRTSLLHPQDVAVSLQEMFTGAAVRDLFRPHTAYAPNGYLWAYDQLKDYPEESRHWSPLRKIMYYRMHHTLPSNMLVKVDRMSMANSLEVRAPFLDPDLYEAASRLPDEMLMRRGQGKYLLRRIMRDKLPPEVFTHPKKGFSIPLYKYQNEAFQHLAKDLLFSDSPLHEILDGAQLENIYRTGISQQQNSAQISVFRSAHQLWMMMQLFGWVRRFEVQVS